MKFKVGEYFVLILVSILVGGLFTWLLGDQHPISAAIGAIGGAVAPGIYVRSQQRKRLQKFNDQLSDMLNLMVKVARGIFHHAGNGDDQQGIATSNLR